jgi:hypothetical protein
VADEQDIEGVEFESDVTPESSITLDEEWVAWLESEQIPNTVEGVDESASGSEGPSIA